MQAGASELAKITFKMFFDREVVRQALNKKEKDILSKAGSFTMTTARNSFKKAKDHKAVAKPGDPPLGHTGQFKKSILFGYDRVNHSVLIGPTLNKQTTPTMPQLGEFGGTAFRNGKRYKYAAHPVMGPALDKNIPNFPDLFTGVLGK